MRRYSITLFALLFSSSLLLAQEYFKVYDLSRKKDVTYVADINSTLKIELNKDNIRNAIVSEIPENRDLLIELKQLNSLLEKEKEIITLLNKSLKEYKSESLAKDLELLGKLSVLLHRFYESISINPVLRDEANKAIEEYFDKKNKGLIGPQMTNDLYAIQHFSSKLENLEKKLEELAKTSKVQFKLGGFLATNNGIVPVHIENFDHYELGEFYEVERFVYALSEETKRELEQYEVLSNELNKLFSEASENFQQFLEKSFSSVKCIRQTDSLFRYLHSNLPVMADDATTAVKKTINTTLIDLQNILTGLVQIENTQVSSSSALESFDLKLQQVISGLPALKDTLDERLNLLIGNSQVRTQAQNIKNQFNTCKNNIDEDLQRLEKIKELGKNVLAPFKKLQNQSAELSDEVIAFKYEDLPAEGNINLKYTGKRKDGDQLILKAIFVKEEQGQTLKKQLEYKVIALERLGLHSDLKVAMLFADPFGNDQYVDLERRFQFIPSYSILFKYGSENIKWNKFFDFGVGLNVSTPDFDLDGIPEIGTGLTASFFRDILHSGLSYNFGAESWFWYAGFSIPLNSGLIKGFSGDSPNIGTE